MLALVMEFPPTTLTTRVSTLYVRLTDSLECHDATLPWILTKLYTWGTTMGSH